MTPHVRRCWSVGRSVGWLVCHNIRSSTSMHLWPDLFTKPVCFSGHSPDDQLLSWGAQLRVNQPGGQPTKSVHQRLYRVSFLRSAVATYIWLIGQENSIAPWSSCFFLALFERSLFYIHRKVVLSIMVINVLMCLYIRTICASPKLLRPSWTFSWYSDYHVTVILNPAASGGTGRKLFEKYSAPLLHLAGMKVSVQWPKPSSSLAFLSCRYSFCLSFRFYVHESNLQIRIHIMSSHQFFFPCHERFLHFEMHLYNSSLILLLIRSSILAALLVSKILPPIIAH